MKKEKLDVFTFKEIPEEDKEKYEGKGLKDMPLQKSVINTVEASFQDMHTMRQYHLNAVESKRKEIERAQQELEEHVEGVKKWENQINSAIEDLPELAEFKGFADEEASYEDPEKSG